MSNLPPYAPVGGPYLGDSGLPLTPLYYQRNYFRNSAPFRYTLNNKNYIDLWYDTPFYGKVNQKGIFYVPNFENLDFSLEDGASGHKFVLDAYHDFKYFMKKADMEGKGNFSNLVGPDYKVTRGHVDSLSAYDNYMKAIIHGYNRELLYKNTGNTISDMLAWAKNFIEKHEDLQAVLSFYSFYAHTQTSIASTGLALSFGNFSHNSDPNKWQYYASPGFPDYAQAAANFGFRINLNAPWQIIADLNSKPMRGFITKTSAGKTVKLDGYLTQHTIPTGNNPHTPNLDYFFETKCTKAIKWSYFLLQSYILNGWENYRKTKKNIVIHANPKATIQSFKAISSAGFSRGTPKIISLEKQKPEEVPASTWFTLLEKILRYEFNATCDAKYRKFRKKYDSLKKEGSNYLIANDKANEALTRLEKYYNITRIFNPNTGKPDWQTQKDLTSEGVYDKMLYDKKPQPTVSEASKDHFAIYGKSVTDYYG